MNRLLLLFLVLVFLSGCSSSRNLTSNNLAFLYKKSESDIHPEFVVYHESDSLTRVYFKLQTSELTYSGQSAEEPKGRALVKLKYQLYPAYESKELVDSASLLITDIGNADVDREIIGNFEVRLPEKTSYLMGIRCTDMATEASVVYYLKVNHNNIYERENFLIRSTQTGQPLFTVHPGLNQPVLITYNRPWKKLYGKLYRREFPIAPAPFALHNTPPFDFTPDSTFAIYPGDSNTVLFQTPASGIFHLQADSSQKDGLSLFHFQTSFPKITQTQSLLEPLRYLTTHSEYKALLNGEHSKKKLDDFWLKNANSPARAKELIRNFYTRVKDANEFFSSQVEGWKTDRGMMYIVFGPPNTIYKSTNSEVWIYGEPNNYMSVNVNFIRTNNPFSDNDFRLQRSPIYKNSWYRGVDSWREGRIISHN